MYQLILVWIIQLEVRSYIFLKNSSKNIYNSIHPQSLSDCNVHMPFTLEHISVSCLWNKQVVFVVVNLIKEINWLYAARETYLSQAMDFLSILTRFHYFRNPRMCLMIK